MWFLSKNEMMTDMEIPVKGQAPWFMSLAGLFLLLLCIQHTPVSYAVQWDEWWTYEGISGPAFWGLINPEWSLCNRGRRQSPINVDPKQLLFDPNLRPLHVDKHRVNGLLSNTGHGVLFTLENATRPAVNITGGPLSYRYEVHQIALHFGLTDQQGSEHTIASRAFPAELQIFGYNAQLYTSFAEALDSPHGIVGLAILLQVGDLSNPELRIITDQLSKIEYAGQEAPIKRLSIKELSSDTEHYVTYEGSFTMPACQETVTWLVSNKPIYITKQQLYALRRLRQGDPKTPSAPMANNYRPIQPTHHRPLRTNIDFTAQGGKTCVTMQKEIYYQANNFWQL